MVEKIAETISGRINGDIHLTRLPPVHYFNLYGVTKTLHNYTCMEYSNFIINSQIVMVKAEHIIFDGSCAMTSS